MFKIKVAQRQGGINTAVDISAENYIDYKSIKIRDFINERVNTAEFLLDVVGEKQYVPVIGQEIYFLDEDENGNETTRYFAGIIIGISNQEIILDRKKIMVSCVDFSHELTNALFTGIYQNEFNDPDAERISDVVIDIMRKAGLVQLGYTLQFDPNNNPILDVLRFENYTVLAALKEIATLTNFYFFVDYYKVIHITNINTDQPAPFNISQALENHIRKSLVVSTDVSQIKNDIRVTNVNVDGDDPQTIRKRGDGIQKTFLTEYDFAEQPTMELWNADTNTKIRDLRVQIAPNVDSSSGTARVKAGLDDAGAVVDVVWQKSNRTISFQQHTPAQNEFFTMTAIPVVPIYVHKTNAVSIAQYGRQASVIDGSAFESVELANLRANSALDVYKSPIETATFKTYRGGLASGQRIHISYYQNEAKSFTAIIQEVAVYWRDPKMTKPTYSVKVSNVREFGIIRWFIEQFSTSGGITSNATETNIILVPAVLPPERMTIQEEDIGTPFETSVYKLSTTGNEKKTEEIASVGYMTLA